MFLDLTCALIFGIDIPSRVRVWGYSHGRVALFRRVFIGVTVLCISFSFTILPVFGLMNDRSSIFCASLPFEILTTRLLGAAADIRSTKLQEIPRGSSEDAMELFMPSLVALLAAVAIAFFLIPSVAPTMLVAGSAVVLAGALYLHYSRFGRMEYEQATWQYNLRRYSSWIMLAAVLLGAYGFYTLSGMAGSGIEAAPAPVESSFGGLSGGGFARVGETVATRIAALARRASRVASSA
jgi:hypothetical protein